MLRDNPDGFQLDADGYAIPACDILSDFLTEHQCDEDEGDPAEWPEWTDDVHWGITDEATLAELRQLDTTPWQRLASRTRGAPAVSYDSCMAQPPPTLEELYHDLHWLEAELLTAPARRVGTRWWDARVAEQRRLRSEVDGAVKRRAASRN